MSRIRAFLRLVVIEHSVFALPFAYLSALTAMYLYPRSCPPGSGSCGWFAYAPANSGGLSWIQWDVLLLVTVAMVAGRTFAMAANRIIDRHVDARNPRTANRELVTGAVSLRTAYVGSAVSLVVFFGAAAMLNPLCLILSPLAVAPLIVYPYGKRFTDFPHAILALAQAVAPVGAWLAVTGTFAGSLPAIVLGIAVGLWIGGFDLIYACQDAEVDRKIGVRSFPSRFGVAAALHTSSAVHVVTFAGFVWFGLLVGFGALAWIGLAITAVTFVYEHAIVSPNDLSKVNRSFFMANGFVGIVLFGFTLADLLLR
ncbi:4-hydroxybenzoate octaprenyltransferase [Stackebrandtia nassauensis]|uniref:4-hydroxybenzoate polyprenyltransferase n=1 Tax=Stackebrandtia nassauensis (strain DSM 44728 / CIP 108903 / NRRL B-16338 / NBRC 102104 / LLR-40K-21) TaxID=446470 RepID=D3Q830_STANL|nr:4-hydroxybenzoate octaprenyltransferase [Stackebrandtia nassauensis]ADD40535.1 4-hydroxybenzoate polyprenyltransferase [Stackebrandtia nassauensis DSM 44728]